MPSSPEKALQTMLNNLPKKTGKSMAQWLKITKSSGLEKHGQILKMLKSEHGVTHGFANLIAAKSLESGKEVDLVEEQYSGAKVELKPIYDALVKYAKTLGKDVEIAPKKISVSLRRKKQFMLITPATKTRIDLGLALKGEASTERLEKYNAMCSHRVRLENKKDLDKQLKDWIKLEYSRA